MFGRKIRNAIRAAAGEAPLEQPPEPTPEELAERERRLRYEPVLGYVSRDVRGVLFDAMSHLHGTASAQVCRRDLDYYVHDVGVLLKSGLLNCFQVGLWRNSLEIGGAHYEVEDADHYEEPVTEGLLYANDRNPNFSIVLQCRREKFDEVLDAALRKCKLEWLWADADEDETLDLHDDLERPALPAPTCRLYQRGTYGIEVTAWR